VWHQRMLTTLTGTCCPFIRIKTISAWHSGDTPHDWISTHEAWNNGAYDRWVPNKGTTAMSYLTRNDIPYHYALADAFTVCDAYYCSLLGPTDPTVTTCGPIGLATTGTAAAR